MKEKGDFKSNEINFYRVDKSLPEIVVSESNMGIDLYSREDIHIPSYFKDVCEYQEELLVSTLPSHLDMITDIPLNIIFKGNNNFNYFIFPRSSLFKKKGLILANSVGVIENSYEGIKDEVCARVINLTQYQIEIKAGERLVQFIPLFRPEVSYREVEEHWGSSSRGGFGSTGGYN